MIEIWKSVKCYEKIYEVSNFGRVKSLDRIVNNHLYLGKILKPLSNGKYLFVKLYKDGKVKRFYIHRLVAEMFLNFNKNDALEINHIDHNKHNNRVDNLEIVTHEENIKKAFDFHRCVSNRYGKFNLVNNSYCVDCGIRISKGYTRCKKCQGKKVKEQTFKKIPKNLLEEIEDMGVCKVAKKYNVSHTTINRWKNKFGRVV